jgi:VWFA-related protein
MKIEAFLALLLSLCLLTTALPQTNAPAPPPPQKTDDDDVVKITTNLVQVDAVVTKDGKIVPNLTADDFEIYEDGKKQTITSFAFISNVPSTSAPPEKVKPTDAVPVAPLNRDDPRRTIALVVDDLGLSAESMSSVRQQLRKFIAEELQPNDIVAIIRTGGELGALQQFTNDKRLLNRAVDRLKWNLCSRVGVHVIPFLMAGPIHHPGDSCGGGSYYQTIKSVRFILDAMGELPGRKSMVLLSDSTPREDQEIRLTDESWARLPMNVNYSGLLHKIAEKAIRSSVVIYSVDTQGLQYTGLTAADHVAGSGRNLSSTSMHAVMSMRSNMLWSRREGGEIIARQTGGFQIRNSNSFELRRILQDQSGYYLLGYRPTDETFNRRFHHIKAKVKRSGMTLRTRFGFFGVSEEESTPAQVSNRNATNLALMSPFAAQDIEINLTSFFTNDKVSGSVIRSFVYIDPKRVTFERAEGRHEASIELHGVVFGDNGTVAHQRAHGVTLSLTDSDYEQAIRHGMALRFDLPVKRAGSYQVRIAARDRASSKIGSAGEFVDVPDLRNKKLAVSGIVLGTTARFSGRDVNEIIEYPGSRSFEPNSDLHFAFVTYNATSTSNLVMEARLFRDGKNLHSGRETPIHVGSDPGRLLVSGSVRLDSDLEVGNYYLQVVITDKNAKDKAAPLVQWIDFAIVK